MSPIDKILEEVIDKMDVLVDAIYHKRGNPALYEERARDVIMDAYEAGLTHGRFYNYFVTSIMCAIFALMWFSVFYVN